MVGQIVPESLEVIRILRARNNHELKRVVAPETAWVHAPWTGVLMLLHILEVFSCFILLLVHLFKSKTISEGKIVLSVKTFLKSGSRLPQFMPNV